MEQEKTKKASKKRKVFWIIVLFLFGIVAIEIGLRFYDKWEAQRLIDDMATELEKMETERQSAMEADKIGGNTPQETLELFISAVETGDYELASQYFVIEEQEKWRGDLSTAENVGELLEDVKMAAQNEGGYSGEKDKFFIHKPILISLVLYPSGNWKIEKI
ncbi:MAG: hypothetical protein ABII97_00130 [Patescibacteria group bacterium]